MTLYSTTTFQFGGHEIFLSFCKLSPPRCLEAIRFLEVRWRTCGPSNKNTDCLFWESLLGLPNLHEVFISILAWFHDIPLCLDRVDQLVCKQGPVLEKLRVVVPYRYFEIRDQRNKDVEETVKATELFRKARRVVSDDSSKQLSYCVESRTRSTRLNSSLWAIMST
jgi:hypothetical protein